MQNIDSGAVKILSVLEAKGYPAFLVGGCVRDLLLGRTVHDWDITTGARPEQVMQCFDKTVPTGLAHGTVSVLLDGMCYEVTTFRTDGSYRDNRRPEHVTYVNELEEDLARRDFTVNAMAMDVRGVLTDCFGGRRDLAAGVIRCVGAAETRFTEDALRMLRALRFCAQLGFVMEPKTRKALSSCAALAERLSCERVRDEVEKTLCSPHPEAVTEMIALGLLRGVGLTQPVDLSSRRLIPSDRLVRWTYAKHMLAELDLSRLRLKKQEAKQCMQAAALVERMQTELDCKRAVADFGWEAALLAAQLNGRQKMLDAIRNSGDCVTLRQLAVRGDDLSWLTGAEISAMLYRLLLHVLSFPEENARERLIRLALEWSTAKCDTISSEKEEDSLE